jgi:LruC domain-containing protein
MRSLRYLAGIVIIAAFTLGSCKKWPDAGETSGEAKLMDNLVVAQNFDWKTTKTVSISIQLPENDPSEVLRIYTEDLEELLYIGYGDESTFTVSTKVTVPTYFSTAVIYYGYNDRYLPVLLGFDKDLSYDYNLDLKSTNADCGCEDDIRTLTMKYNGSSATTIRVQEEKKNKDPVVLFSNTVGAGAQFSFTGKDGGKMNKNIYFYIGNDDDANTSMQVDCKYNLYNGDTFGEFTLISGTSKDDTPLCEKSNECGCDGGLVNLKLRYVGSSTANVKIMAKQGKKWVTYVNSSIEPNQEFSFNGDGKDGKLKNSLTVFVNNSENTSIHTSCSVDIEIGDTYGSFRIVEGFNKNNLSLCGSIEDVNTGGGNTGGGNNGGSGNSGSTTTTTTNGTLAYEDLWPSKGDYDFNDLVINYDFVVTKDNQNRILNISSTFIVYAFGASFHNAFGFELPGVRNNQIISVTGSDIASSGIFVLTASGLELNQPNATIIVYDDSYRLMTHPGVGIGINTVEGAPYVTPDTIVVNMVFYQNGAFPSGGSVSFEDLDIGNFNPFIVVNQTRGREVHLPNFAPTALADDSYLGTFNDDSDAATNRYYKSNTNLPWAINIPEVFNYPYEKKDIVSAYKHFAEWAETSGTAFPNWYQDNSGYRVSSFIYNPN